MRRIIAVAGPHGSGKSVCAKSLAVALNMKYISAGQIFRQMAKERGVSLEEFSRMVVAEPEIDIEIDNRTKELGQIDNTIVDAQLASYFTPDDIALNLNITASKQTRWKRIAKREKISLEEGKKETETREDVERSRFLKLYDIDVDDLEVYDVIINTDRLDIEETFDLALIISKSQLDKI